MQCAGHRWIWCRWLKHHLWSERKHRPTKARTSEIKQWIIISYPREFTQPIHAHQYAYSKRLKRSSPANEICSISSLKRWLCNVCILSGPNPTSKKSGPDWWILAKDNNTIQHQFTSNINVMQRWLRWESSLDQDLFQLKDSEDFFLFCERPKARHNAKQAQNMFR